MSLNDLITVDPEIVGGMPVFKGTRLPVRTMFEYFENNYTLEGFLECFPSVTKAGYESIGRLRNGFAIAA